MRRISAWKRHLKNFLAFVLYQLGIVWLLEKIVLRNRCVVLAYHRVCEPELGEVPVEEGMTVSPRTFEAHLRYLRKRYNLLSLETFLTFLSSGQQFQKGCLLTFDDGWADTYSNAFPLLKKYGAPAAIFLATGYIGTEDWFWPEKVNYLLSNFDPRRAGLCTTEEASQTLRLYRSYATDPPQGIHKAIQYLKQLDNSRTQDILLDLMRASGIERFPQKRAMLNWTEVNEMAQWGISFGSHGKSHAILTRVKNPYEVEEELRESRQTIADRTGIEPVAFCFPNGDFDDNLIEAVRACGYRAAFIGSRGFVTVSDDPYKLKRVSIHEGAAPNTARLACRIVLPWF